MNGTDQWYYLDGSETRGPVASAQIAQLVKGGSLSASTQVAQAGWQTWTPASSALAHLLNAPAQGAAPGVAPAAVPSAYAIKVQCISGPDTGKAYMIGAGEVSLGRVSGIGAYDPGIAENHVVLSWQNNVLFFRAFPGARVRVAGVDVTQGTLSNGQQFQIGQSVWQVGSAPVDLGSLVGSLGDRLRKLSGGDKLEGFNLSVMFSEVFKGRKQGEIDEYFVVGSDRTTPAIDDVQTGWPRPWFFMRVLLFLLIGYAGLYYGFQTFSNEKLIPGIMMIGALVIPLATVFFFFEMNTPRNVSFAKVLMLVCLGGIASLFLALTGFEVSNLDWMGASSAGIVEEIGKLLAVVLVVRQIKYKYILNGILFGAAIGGGFAAFESAGYAFDAFLISSRIGFLKELQAHQMKPIVDALSNGDAKTFFNILYNAMGQAWFSSGAAAMFDSIQTRALLAPFGHIVWTAISAGAMWRVKRDQPFKIGMLFDPSFLRTLLIPMCLHAIWNSNLIAEGVLGTLERVGLGVVGYFVAFSLVQQGLRQVRTEQLEHTRSTFKQSQEILTTSGRFQTRIQ